MGVLYDQIRAKATGSSTPSITTQQQKQTTGSLYERIKAVASGGVVATPVKTKIPFPLVYESESAYLDAIKADPIDITKRTISPIHESLTKPALKALGFVGEQLDLLSGFITKSPELQANILAGQEKLKGLTEENIEGFKELGLKESAVPFGIALSVIGDPLNLFGGGGKNLAKLIAKSEDANYIFKLLRPVVSKEIDDPALLKLAKDLVPITDEKSIEQILTKGNLYERARIASEASDVVKKVPTPKGLPELPKIPRASQERVGIPSKRIDSQTVPGTGTSLPPASKRVIEEGTSAVSDVGQTTRYTRPSTSKRFSIQEHITAERKRAQANLKAYTDDIAKATGLEPNVRVKEEPSFVDKIARTQAEGRMLDEINDTLAARIIVRTENVDQQIDNVAQSFEIDKIKDYRDVPSEWGFRGTNVVVRLPDGAGLAEIQIHTPRSRAISKEIHGIYEKWRARDISKLTEAERAERRADVIRSRAISERIWASAEDAKLLSKTSQKTKGQVRAEGRRFGKAEAENVANAKQAKAIRSEQLKALRGGIELRAKKDKIITVLKNTAQSSQRIKDLIVDYAKDALSIKNRGKAMVLLRDAKTQRDLTKTFARINRWAEEEIKIDLRNDILKMQRTALESPSVAIDYKARIKELMGDFELKGHRESTLERLKATQEFLENEAKKGNDIDMPRRVLRALELLNRTPFVEITINQLKGLQAEMELLEDLGRTKFRTIESIWETQKTKIFSEVEEQAAPQINKIELIRPEIGERLTITQKAKNVWWGLMNQAARIDKVISPMDVVFDTLDGGKGLYTGANFRFFKGQVDAGYGRYITRKDALQSPIVELATKYKLDDTNFERMGVVAAREQDGGMEKLLASGFTEEQVNAVKLTKEEQEVLDAMRTTFDSQFPEIQDVMRRVYNQPVEKVKNYFSFMTDFKAMDESEVFQRFGSQLPEQFGAPRKNVEAGFTKHRVGGEQKIRVNAMDVFLAHTDNTSYLLELGETTKMLGEVAASPRYAELVGDAGQLLVREWVDVIARKGGASGAQQIAILDMLRRNVGAGILGLKLSTIAIQPTALVDGAGFIGANYAMRGAGNFLTNGDWRKFVANMPEIKDRMGGEFALRELTDENLLQEIQRKGFIPMQKLDQMTAGMIAAGAYERKMIELGKTIDLTKGYDPEAMAYAQLAVRRTQSSGSFKDVPLAVSRGALTGNRSLDRAMLQFQNFLLTRWSRIRHDAIRAGINTKDPKKAIPVFTAVIMAGLAGSGIRLGVNKAQDFITGREDEDSVQEDLTKSFMYEMTGNVPFLGTAVSMAMYDGEMFPILDAPKGIIKGLNRVVTSKSEGAKLRGFAEFAGSTGALLGIPGSTQAETMARGLLQNEKKKSAGLPVLPKIPKLPGLPKLPKIPSLR